MRNTHLLACSTLLVFGVLSQPYAHAKIAAAGEKVKDVAQFSAVSITGTYFETSNNALNSGEYLLSAFDPGNSASAVESIFLDPSHELQYVLGYTYRIPCTDAHFVAWYEHYDVHDAKSSSGQLVNLGIAPFFNDISDVGNVQQAQQKYYDFSFGFSNLILFSPRYEMEYSAFFGWNEIIRSTYELATGLNTAGDPIASSRSVDNKMQGWGPGVGVLTNVRPFCNLNWAFFVDAKASVIWAKNTYSMWEVDAEETAPFFDTLLHVPQASHSLVGKLDLNFGVTYCHAFQKMLLEADLGLRYMNVFNAFKNGNAVGNQGPNQPITTTTGFPVDFGLFGPFLKFRIGGAKA